MKSNRRPRSLLSFPVIATLLFFVGGVVLNSSGATSYSPMTLFPDLNQDCRDACLEAHHAAREGIEAAHQAGEAAIDAMEIAMFADARADLDAVLNNPNATNERKNAAQAAYAARLTEIVDFIIGLKDALWAAKDAAFQLAYLAYQACLAACALIPPIDIEIEIPFLP